MTSTEQWNAVPATVRHLFIKYAATARDLAEDHEDDLQGRYIDTPEVGRIYMCKHAEEAAKPPLLHRFFNRHSDFQRMLGGPNPLAAALVSGALGAGLGYGGGWLAQKFFPKKYMRRGPLARNMAIAGGLLGAGAHALPWALPQYAARRQAGQGFFDSLTGAFTDPGAFGDLDKLRGAGSLPADMRLPEMVPPSVDWSGVEKTSTALVLEHAEKEFEVAPSIEEDFEKIGIDFSHNAFVPQIPVNQFNNFVMNDPNTPRPIQAATAGLTTAASMSRGGVNLVSPFDVGKIAVGMGSGLVSGMLVGKTLGALAGLTPVAQEKIQNAGVMAGMLTNVVPMAFR